MSFVESKLHPPEWRGEQLERRELIGRLDVGLERRVVLVCAPAGFGKSWLVADWLGFHADVAQVWMSMDVLDNDPARLWLHLVEGIRREFPDVSLDEELFASGSVDVDRIVDLVVAGLEECGEQVVVVLDDVHVIEEANAVRSLERLVAEAPESTHLVFVGRHDPKVRLSRWRVAAELVELRASDLRLTLDEASRVIAAFIDRPVANEVVAVVHDRMGGWIAGFRLAALAAAKGDDPDADLQRLGRGRAEVADLLMDEVLSGMGPAVRDFLLETSLLAEVNGALCDAMTGNSDAEQMLAGLIRDGMFIVATGERGGWYRIHDVFRELLQIELRRIFPDRVPVLHGRAALWFHDNGRPVEAIQHTLSAGEAALAADWLIEASLGLQRSGQMQTLIRLATEIDEALDEPSLRVLGLLAHTLFVEGGSGAAQFEDVVARVLEVATNRDAEGGEEGWEWSGYPLPFQGRDDFIGLWTATLARRAGDPGSVLAFKPLLPTKFGILDFIVAEALIWLERYSEAEPLTMRYVEWAPLHGAPSQSTTKALGLLAMIATGKGRLDESDQLAGQALDLRWENPGRTSAQGSYARIAHAWVGWERGDLARAESSLTPALELAIRQDELAAYALCQILSSRIKQSMGDRAGARTELDRALVTAFGRVPSEFFSELIVLERTRLALLEGDLVAAELALPDWQKRIANGAATMREHLLLARFVVAAGGDPSQLLEEMPKDCEITLPHRIQIGLLKSLAAIGNRDEDRALEELTVAMRWARVSGHRQQFLDERSTLRAVLDNAAAHAGMRLPASDVSRLVLDDRDHIRRAEIEPIDLVEQLSERELDVLRMLPSHHTYTEIGDELGVSMNTVKYHIRAIYRKLEADGRADAVHIAQRCGLVSENR
jgi:LuxR family maltose regulon positive regulatory protein